MIQDMKFQIENEEDSFSAKMYTVQRIRTKDVNILDENEENIFATNIFSLM